jgi:hypothetical protein
VISHVCRFGRRVRAVRGRAESLPRPGGGTGGLDTSGACRS